MADTTLTRIWSTVDIALETRDKWLEFIKSAYQRPYYDLDYLSKKLQHYETCQQSLKEPEAVLLALVFQSIHYSSNSEDNLERCLEKFGEFATEAGLNESKSGLVKAITELIQISVSNSSNEFWEDGTFGQEDSHYFLDINFAHLADEWEDYKTFSDKTRNEYEFLSAENYTKLRRKVLQSFLHIPNIYATAQFRTQHEGKARENINREIAELN